MMFLKKVLLGIAAFVLILWGGAGTQSNSLLLQGGGFVGLIAGLIILYIFTKMAWRAMGCVPSMLLVAGIILFIIYAIGGFRGGIGNISGNLRSFMGQNTGEPRHANPFETHARTTENFGDNIVPEEESTVSQLMNYFNVSGEPAEINPTDFPVIYGEAKVINGDTLKINGKYLRLYGIDAPETNQTCANGQGRAYRCGQVAGDWLRSWINGYTLECRIMQQDNHGNMVGTCALGQYDLGAALVNAGWAVAYLKYTDIYYPYEEEARLQRRGLWEGKFYMPWDWRAQQAQTPSIKIIKAPSRKKKSLLDV